MANVTRKSKKEDLWQEIERLRLAGSIHEDRIEHLEQELEKARERSGFTEQSIEKIRATHAKFELLTSLTRELTGLVISFDVDGVLALAVRRIPFLVEARYASVWLLDRGKNQLVLRHHNHDRELDRVVDLAANPSSLMATAARTQETLCIGDLGSHRTPDGEPAPRPYRDRYTTTSCMVVPLVAGGDVEGILNLADRFDRKPFDRALHLAPIRQACELLAISLRNARLFAEVQRASQTCTLTGLQNQQAFRKAIEVEVRRALRYEKELAVVACRCRGLRLINANCGRAAGDQVLRDVSRLLVANVRDVDVVARTGGAEFGVLLPEQGLEGAVTAAHRLARIFAETPFAPDGIPCEVHTVFGAAAYARSGGGAELFQSALGAIDRAAEAGEAVGVA